MKVYMTDEVSFEITEYDIPDQLAATGPMWRDPIDNTAATSTYMLISSMVNDAHFIGVIEGWIARDVRAKEEMFNRDHPFVPDPGNPYLEYRIINGVKEMRSIGVDWLDSDAMLDDSEYIAKRNIERHDDGTLTMTARFGRDKKWFMAINRDDDRLAKQAVEQWIGKETAE